MAKRKKKFRTYRRGKGGTKKLIAPMVYAVAGEPLLDMLASKLGLGVSDDIVKAILAYFIAQNTSGMVRSVSETALLISAYKVSGQYLGNVLGGLGTTPAPAPAAPSNSFR